MCYEYPKAVRPPSSQWHLSRETVAVPGCCIGLLCSSNGVFINDTAKSLVRVVALSAAVYPRWILVAGSYAKYEAYQK